MKKILFLIASILSTSIQLFGQEQLDEELEKMVQVPDSPEVSEFMRYGDVTANLYSGTPEISIPLYTINGSEINIPISLTYNASGIKVEQEASWVGLGWNLDIGGRISRIVNGLPDDPIQNGSTHSVYSTINNSSTKQKILFYSQNLNQNVHPSVQSAHDYLNFMHDVSTNAIDAQPDFYSMFAPGINEYFIPDINDANNINRAVNNPRIQIIKNNNNNLITWEVKSENGTIYFFNENEKNETHNTVTSTNSIKNAIVEYENSWVLTKIISPNSKDIFEFEYYEYDYYRDHVDYNSQIDEIVKMPNSTPNVTYSGTSAVANWSTKKVLKQVKHNDTLVLETNLQNRFDVGSSRSNTRLNNIQIKSHHGKSITQFRFNNEDYFNLDGLSPEDKDYRDIRLKLNSIDQLNSTGDILKTHSFTYIQPDDLPSRTSKAKDYYGYYNGHDGNTSQLEACTVAGINFSGANRNPSTSNHAAYGLLEKITYPTGGSTVFNYEKHDYHTSRTETNEVNVSDKFVNQHTAPRISYVFGECDDQFQNPIITSSIFTLTEQTSLKIYYGASGNGSNSQGFILNQPIANYCQLNPSIIEWTDASYPGQSNITLPAGTYSLVVLIDLDDNGQGGATNLSVTKQVIETIDENEVIGGVRIAEITDYSSDNIIAKKRQFQYQDEGKSTGLQNYIPRLTIFKEYRDEYNRPVQVVNRRATFNTPNMPMVTYDLVKEFVVDRNNDSNGHILNEFYRGPKGIVPNTIEPFGNNFIPNLENGQLKLKTIRNSENKDVQTENYEYSQYSGILVRGLSAYKEDPYRFESENYNYIGTEINVGTDDYAVLLSYSVCCWGDGIDVAFDGIYNGLKLGITSSSTLYGGLSKKTTKQSFYDDTGNVLELTNSSETVYNSTADYLPEKNTITKSDGGKIETTFFYPKNLTTASSPALISQNKLATVLKSEVTVKDVNENILSTNTRRTTYKDLGGNLILPDSIFVSKNNGPSEGILVYKSYDDKGNLTEFARPDGMTTTILWGYDTHYPIAKIENATFSQVESAIALLDASYNTLSEIQDLSDADDDNCSESENCDEKALREALRDLQEELDNAMVTTYTYDPLVGVTSITDPRGYTIYYEYDEFNRLKEVRDDDGNLLTDHQYHLK